MKKIHFNKLGKTNLKVSEIGIGTEFLFGESNKIVNSILSKALEYGINYIDVLFSVKHYLEKLAPTLKEYRDQIIITGHIGTVETAEKRPKKTRSINECKEEFNKILNILKIDYVDIINIQFIGKNEFEKIMKSGGLFDLASSYKKQGNANFLGLSTHDTFVAEQAINCKKFDMIMFPLNVANHYLEGRENLLNLVKRTNTGLIAIKPFAAGNLLQSNRLVRIAKYQTGGLSFKIKNPPDLTPSKCLNYVSSIPEVSTVLMGIKSEEELEENLKYSELESEKDWSTIVKYYKI